MLINPINKVNNNQIHPLQSFKQGDVSNFGADKNLELSGYEAGRAILAQRNILFTSQPLIKKVNSCCTLTLTDESCAPKIHIGIESDKNTPIKQGLFLLNSMALNDQIYEKNQENGQVITSRFSCKPYSKNIDFVGSQSTFLQSLEMLDDCLFRHKIDSKHLDTAKKLAPVALFLSRRTDEYKDELFDIPQNMTEKQYEKLIETISLDDLSEYNDNILKNSHIEINVCLNKNFYNQNSEILLKYFNSWANSYENQ